MKKTNAVLLSIILLITGALIGFVAERHMPDRRDSDVQPDIARMKDETVPLSEDVTNNFPLGNGNTPAPNGEKISDGVSDNKGSKIVLDQDEFIRDLAIVNALRGLRTAQLVDYEKLADELRAKWREGSREYYGKLIVNLCGQLISDASSPGNDKQQDCVARKYALDALDQPGQVSMPLEWDLTGLLSIRYGKEDFVLNRREDVAIRLHVMQRTLDLYEPDFEPPPNFSPKVGPPKGVPYPIRPEEIDDPVLRAEYEKRIQNAREMMDKIIEQTQAKRAVEYKNRKAEKLIVNMYSFPPHNLDELRQVLGENLKDEDLKRRIYEQVEENIKKGIHP